MCNIDRRRFLTGCSAGIAAMAGTSFNTLAFADPDQNEETLIVLFLRGGMDGLNFMPPLDGVDRGHYEAARPTLQVPASGAGAAINLNSQFGLHPSAAPLHGLYQDGHLSIIQATGMLEASRSHFDAMAYMELGTPGQLGTPTGWLTRYLASATNLPGEVIMPSLSVGNLQTNSLRGSLETLNLSSPGSFNLEQGHWLWRRPQRASLRRLLGNDTTWLHQSSVQALNAVDIIELNAGEGYNPANGAVYPDTHFGEHLQTVAQLLKLDLGLSVATLDLGGWDTHNGQGQGSGGLFAALVDELSSGLAALYQDLDGAGANNYMDRVTIVVQSEFGRRFEQNSDNGTDHGYGNLMMVLSGNATGGIHGSWPGLAPGQLFEGDDLAVTTDYRQVLSEILIRRMCNPRLGDIFPDYSGYNPLGVVAGTDLVPVYNNEPDFQDGFESGDTAGWTQTVVG